MITNPTPIVTEPIPSKTFDKLHVYSLTAIQPEAGAGSITIELLPATATGELAPSSEVQKLTCPLYPAIEEVPELAEAFAAVLAAIPAVRAWMTAQEGND